MNLANKVFNFVKTQSDESAAGEILHGINLLSNQYEKNFAKRNVKVGEVQKSEPMILPNGEVKEFNAYLPIQTIVKPESQRLEDMHAAREDATAIVLELAKRIYLDGTLNGAGCTAKVLQKQDNWKDLNAQKVAESLLFLLINEKKV